jgi:hypothetical protein
MRHRELGAVALAEVTRFGDQEGAWVDFPARPSLLSRVVMNLLANYGQH